MVSRGVTGRAGSAAVTSHTCQVFTCEVVLACYGPPAVPFGEIEAHLRQLERRFSRFRADSEISGLNANAGHWWDISPRLYAILAHALNVAIASQGLVNIAVLPCLLAAGYTRSFPAAAAGAPADRPSGGSAPAPRPVPPLSEVLELRPGQARLQPGTAVDIGAIAKGLWADEVASRLGDNCGVSLGGDVSCRGPGPDGDGWPVALPDGQVVTVRNGGVATSGTGRRRWGRDAHHLIDPRTGRPSRSDIVRATVIATTGAAADWVSSALVVGGTPAAPALTARPEVRHARWSTTEEP